MVLRLPYYDLAVPDRFNCMLGYKDYEFVMWLKSDGDDERNWHNSAISFAPLIDDGYKLQNASEMAAAEYDLRKQTGLGSYDGNGSYIAPNCRASFVFTNLCNMCTYDARIGTDKLSKRFTFTFRGTTRASKTTEIVRRIIDGISFEAKTLNPADGKHRWIRNEAKDAWDALGVAIFDIVRYIRESESAMEAIELDPSYSPERAVQQKRVTRALNDLKITDDMEAAIRKFDDTCERLYRLGGGDWMVTFMLNRLNAMREEECPKELRTMNGDSVVLQALMSEKYPIVDKWDARRGAAGWL